MTPETPRKIEVGQTVFLTYIGANRKSCGFEGIREVKVTKVGRKWFDIDGFYRHSFSVETGKQKPSDYMADYFVYFDKEHMQIELQEKADRESLAQLLYRTNAYRMTIEQVREILQILKSL